MKVEYYGQLVPLKQVARFPFRAQFSSASWDRRFWANSRLQKADIGANKNDSKMIRLTMPR